MRCALAIDAFVGHVAVLGSGVAFLRAAAAWPPAVVQQESVERLSSMIGACSSLTPAHTTFFVLVGAPVWIWGDCFEARPQVDYTNWLVSCKSNL